MSKQHPDKEFVSYVIELMHQLGPVVSKRMFGGHGIFQDGLMFAIIVDGRLYFKADKTTEKEFLKRNLGIFTYKKKGKDMRISYYQAPEETLEDADEMYSWGRKALNTALSAAAGKRQK